MREDKSTENQNMNHCYYDFYIISKITPVFPSGEAVEEYIVSEDLFLPFSCLNAETHVDRPLTSKLHRNEIIPENDSYLLIDQAFLGSGDASLDTELLCQCVNSLAFVKFKNKVKVAIDAILFSLIMLELRRSKPFRKNTLKNVLSHFIRSKKLGTSNVVCEKCDRSSLPIHSLVYLNPPKKNILDYKWGRKVQVLVNEKCELENAMAWLSTLGGAFSALGDTYIQCAKRAGAISIQQLYIALRIGDPLTICRCKIYLAMSLLQRGYYKKTQHMIRELYKFSTGAEGSKDFRLRNMCLAVWNRLRYLLSQRAIKKTKAQ